MAARPVTSRPVLGRGLLTALALIVGTVCAVSALRGDGFLDLAVYRFGGEAVLRQWPLYDVAFEDGAVRLPFTYPPFAALAMTGLSTLPFWLLAGLWSALGVLALAGTVALFLREWPGRVPSYVVPLVAACALAFEPVWSSLSYGQINLFLMLAVVVDLLRGDRRGAGLLIGIAAGLKLTPLLFVVFLVLIARRRAAATALLGFAGTVLVGFLLLPRTSVAYWTDVLWDPGRVGGVHFASNQSVLGGMARWLGHEPSTAVWFLVAGALTLGTLLVAARCWRADDRDLAVALAGVAMLLASPISWSHHWVWAVPAALALARLGAWLPWAVWVAVFVVGPVRWPPRSDDAELSWTPSEQLAGNGYLLAALALVVVLAVRRPARTRPTPLTCRAKGVT